MDGIGGVVVIFYLIAHIPAFIMLIVGGALQNKKPKTSRILYILSGIYFLIGGGICGLMLGGF